MEAPALGAQLEQLLLQLVPEVDPGGELEGQGRRRRRRLVDLIRLRDRDQRRKTLDRPLDVASVGASSSSSSSGSTSAVRNERPSVSSTTRNRPRPSTRTFIRPSSKVWISSITAVPRADLAEPVVVLEDQPELALVGQALADQLLVAILEDVQRDALVREQHELEREKADFRHAPEA